MPTTIDGKVCLTTDEVGRRLECGRAKVFELRRLGRINGVRVGNQTYTTASSVETYLASEAARVAAGLRDPGE